MDPSTIDRRQFLKISALVAAGLTFAPGIAFAKTKGHTRGAELTPMAPLWGAYCRPRGGESWQTALTDLESLTGRTMSITRHYLHWNDPAPDYLAQYAASGGRVPYLSLHAFTSEGDHVPWSQIAAGQYDSQLLTWANNLKSWGVQGYLNFHHEPENDTLCGTGADFKTAFAHVRTLFDAVGVTNFTWGVALMASTLKGGHGGPDAWLPDPSLYSVLVVDGYNRFPCDKGIKHWRSFNEIFSPAHLQATARGKKLLIGEYGTVEQVDCGYTAGSPTAKAQWLSDAVRTMKSWPEVVGAIYSHTTATFNGQIMNYWVDTTAQSLASFTTCGHNSYFS